jgi:hypothetical protein
MRRKMNVRNGEIYLKKYNNWNKPCIPPRWIVCELIRLSQFRRVHFDKIPALSVDPTAGK